MKFSITNNGGQFQFWHMDCEMGKHEKPMHEPKELLNGIKEFTCVACERVGRVTMPFITTGSGELETD